jgi:hypothetical protein
LCARCQLDNKIIATERKKIADGRHLICSGNRTAEGLFFKPLLYGSGYIMAVAIAPVREDFTLTEAVAIKQAIEPLLKAEAKARMAVAGPKTGRGKKTTGPAKLADPLKGQTRDKVAKRTGKKRNTLAKAEKVGMPLLLHATSASDGR